MEDLHETYDSTDGFPTVDDSNVPPYYWPLILRSVTLVILALLPLVILAMTEYLFQCSAKEIGLFKLSKFYFAIFQFAGINPCRPFLSGPRLCCKNHGTFLSFINGKRSRWGPNVVGRLCQPYSLFHAISGGLLLALGCCLFFASKHHLNKCSSNPSFGGFWGHWRRSPNGS